MTDTAGSLAFWTGLLAGAVVFGGIGGMIGGRLKGRPVAGFVYGALLGPFGLLVALAMGSDLATCPQCKSLIPRDATVCRYCRAKMKQPKSVEKLQWPEDPIPWSRMPAEKKRPEALSADIEDWLSGRKQTP